MSKTRPNHRPLGKTQQEVLRCLREHRGWHRGCGWLWTTVSGTERILESLVRRGLVSKKRLTGRNVWGDQFRYEVKS